MTETHSGVVFFVGDRAYKLKKPVQFGFLDFRSREAREAVCHREVELNRRLAPDVYLGVADVYGPDGRPIDHLVAMRRLPADRRLTHLVESSAGAADQLRRLAHVLAAFHARAATAPEIDRAAGRDALATRWQANAAEMTPFVGSLLDSDAVGRAAMLAERYLAGRGPLFEARVADGRARDGHGDLLADDIFCLDDGPRVLDCLEFDDQLRWGDALADVAFLAMDLERLGRPDLAAAFLGQYREVASDTWPASLAHHYVAYRALVRCKVACLRSTQGDGDSSDQARQLLRMTVDHLEAARVRLVVVGGPPGTGKSTLARGLGDALDAVVLRSDEVRKQRAGLDPATAAGAPLGRGIYSDAATEATYRTLLVEARTCLRGGLNVVLDASWSDARWRDEARRLAGDAVADLHELRCTVPRALAVARLEARAARGGDASDADAAVAEAMAASEAPWPTAMEVDTSASPGEVVASVLARLADHPIDQPGGALPLR
ncbi:MAG TPA: AAA family ATPase [Acidimicrobiales bacterium]|nr:AAA family ATPase [Acidimicrobiales bacterium]